MYKILEYVPNAKRQPVDDLQGVQIESELGKIVLVNKNLMDDWRKQQEVLRSEMEETSNKVESSLRSEKYDYEKEIAKLEKVKTDELNSLNQKYEELQQAEAEQKDDNTQ